MNTPLKIEDLIVGATYSIDHQDGDYGTFMGHARFVCLNGDGKLEFSKVDGDHDMLAHFDIGEVRKLVSLPS